MNETLRKEEEKRREAKQPSLISDSEYNEILNEQRKGSFCCKPGSLIKLNGLTNVIIVPFGMLGFIGINSSA